MNDPSTTLLVVSAIVTPIVGAIVTVFTLIWKDRQAVLREERTHRWDAQDRERLSLALATKVEDARVQVAEASAQHVHDIRADIKDNTRKTEAGALAAAKAYDEANHANEKNLDLNAKIIDLNERLLAREGETS